MSKEKESHDNHKMQEIMNQYQDSMRRLIQQGKLGHRELEKHLTDVMNQLSQEVQEKTRELLEEAEAKQKKNCPCPHCGQETRVNAKAAKIEVLTTQGVIEVYRDWYFCRSCGKGFSPVDTMLGLDEIGHKITPEMAAKIAYAGQMAPSFEAAEQSLNYLMGLQVSAYLIRQITEETGEKVHEQQMEAAEQAVARPEEAAPAALPHEQKPGTLYVMADGSQVNTREQGRDGSSWKEMKLGLVYSDDHVLTRKRGQSVLVDKEYVAYFGGVEGFKKLLFDAAARAGYGTYQQAVVIGDGAHWIWNMCEELFPDAIQVLDYYHMCENVYNYAKYLYPSDDSRIKGWAESMIAKIEKGDLDGALASIPLAHEAKLPAGVPNLHTYLSNNRNRMNYKALQQRGIKIGSGAVESGNKKVIQQRMKQSGMRWNVKTGQSVASLRAKSASGRWADVERILRAA